MASEWTGSRKNDCPTIRSGIAVKLNIMATTLTDATLLKNDHRRRRWIIRICLSSLFILILVVIVGFVLLSPPTGIPFDEAVEACSLLKGAATREQVEHLLGMPCSVRTDDYGFTELCWEFFKLGINQDDLVYCMMKFDQKGIKLIQHTDTYFRFTGWGVWGNRWQMLKRRFGIK